MLTKTDYEVWFVTGSQHLYGSKTLEQVAVNSKEIAKALDGFSQSVRIVHKPIVTTATEIVEVCRAANNHDACIGVICWMHTFSPAKMWITGLGSLTKPYLHLHTQFSREIPWDAIDMDFMNLNQSAHGDREFGFIGTRLRIPRQVIVGYWQDAEVLQKLDTWCRAAKAHAAMQTTKVARFGDNMRDVAVTEGNKVSAQIVFGYEVHGYGVGDLVKVVNAMTESDVDGLVSRYMDEYKVASKLRETKEYSHIREAARLELGMRTFLEDGGFTAFTTTFEDLNGLSQLPGLACQRLMNDGYGFGAEGDWKTSALLRAMKIMAEGLEGGTSFMEDYTYHMPKKGPAMVLGAHMLEVCPSISREQPTLEIHPLSIGGKADPVRLIFQAADGPALNATVIDLGNRFRMLVNEVDAVIPKKSLPNLPVAQALWIPRPNLNISAAAWIYGGGAHHTVYSQAVSTEHLRNYCEMAGIECCVIDNSTEIESFKDKLRYNHLYYLMAQ